MSADQAQLFDALQSLGGIEFDKLHLKQQILHTARTCIRKDVCEVRDDPNVRQLATAAVPVIGSHSEMGNQMATNLGSQQGETWAGCPACARISTLLGGETGLNLA